MKVITPDTLALLFGISPDPDSEHDGCALVLACLACFPFAPHVQALLEESVLWDCATAQLPPGVSLDEGHVKPRGEFLVYGSCHAGPEQKLQGVTRARDVEVRVGTLCKELTVFGERFWHGAHHGDPEPFSSLPVTWENAFGGADNPDNPLGKGQDLLPDGRRPLPHVERQGEYVSFPHDMPEPVGLGAMDVSWAQRRMHAGTHGREWLRERWPGMPADTCPELFMRAQEDQWLPGFFHGDETFEIVGMHPHRERLRGVLPAVRCRVFVLRGEEDAREFKELQTRADTLTLFPERELGALTFRAVTHTQDEECCDIAALLAVFEPSALPAEPAERYRELMEQALLPPQAAAAAPEEEKEEEAENNAADAESEAGADAQPEAREDVAVPAVAELEQVLAEIEAESRQTLAKAGLTQQDVEDFLARMEKQTRELFPSESMERTVGEDPLEDLRDLVKELEAQGRNLLRKSGKSEEEVEAFLEQQKGAEEFPDLEREFAPRLRDPAVSEEIKTQMRSMINAVAEISAVCASLEQLGKEAGQQAAAEESVAQEPEPAIEPEPEPLTREEVLARYTQGLSLAGTDLSGLDLSGLDLPGIDLCAAVLRNTNCGKANLAGARLCNADCGGGVFDGCTLEDADLSAAVLEKCSMRELKAKGLKAPQAGFQEVDATGADFTAAELEDADFTRAVLDASCFHEARAPGLRLLGASLKEADFRNAGLRESRGDTQTDAPEADFSGAEMALSGWRGACLREANMTGAVLDASDLGHCDLRGAHLVHAQAKNAVFFKADLENAKLSQAVLEGADLRRARLVGAHLSGAVLRGADLYKSVLDNTELHLADLQHTLLDPNLLDAFPE